MAANTKLRIRVEHNENTGKWMMNPSDETVVSRTTHNKKSAAKRKGRRTAKSNDGVLEVYTKDGRVQTLTDYSDGSSTDSTSSTNSSSSSGIGGKIKGAIGAIGQGSQSVVNDIESGEGIDVIDTGSNEPSGSLGMDTDLDDSMSGLDDDLDVFD